MRFWTELYRMSGHDALGFDAQMKEWVEWAAEVMSEQADEDEGALEPKMGNMGDGCA